MRTSFFGLGVGVAMAIVLVYLLIVVNFQSWVDPLIIVSALPAALAGIVWMLFLTGTHLSVPALTGAIMTMGVATANSILMVSFARQRLSAGAPPLTAALEAGASRIRPVLMTAFAMIIGMIPMALGLGEGAEQNAPLGRAVIGGLLFATVSTLFFVPLVFAGIHTPPRTPQRRRAWRARGTTTTACADRRHSTRDDPVNMTAELTEMTEKTHASLAIPARDTEGRPRAAAAPPRMETREDRHLDRAGAARARRVAHGGRRLLQNRRVTPPPSRTPRST